MGQGQYWEEVLATGSPLEVRNAREDPAWDHNPALKLGLVCCLGLPIRGPSGELLGALCVLDTQERDYSPHQRHLLQQLRALVECDLALRVRIDLHDRLVIEYECSRVALEQAALQSDLLHRITSLPANVGSHEEALECALEVVCCSSGWALGHAYVIDPENQDRLLPSDIWYSPDSDRFRGFRAVTLNTNFERGIGLPGRVLQSGEPVWIVDVQKDENFPRAKLEVDIEVRGAMAFPIKIETRLVAVLEFFAAESIGQDDAALAMMSQVSAQLSRVFERRQWVDTLEAHVVELERSNQELRDFAHVVSHDLGSPIRTVQAYTREIVAEYGAAIPPEALDVLDTIGAAAQRMQELITDVLGYTKLGANSVHMSRQSTTQIVANVLSDLGAAIEEAGASVTVGELPDVAGDRTLLSQLFQNLIANALKYRAKRPCEIWIEAEKGANEWQFVVADNGVGIPQQLRERIFDAFRQVHPGYAGSGIGLSTCKKIVELHGGRIWPSPRDGEGTTMHFTLPEAEPEKEDAP